MDPDPQPVQLSSVPVGQFLDLLGYFDDVTRELRLIQLGAQGNGAIDLAAEVTFTHKDTERIRRLLHHQARDACARGLLDADLSIDLDLGAVPDAHDLGALLHRMDTASRDGELLTPPVGAQPLDLLDWMVAEVDRQLIAGKAPRPFGA